MPPKRTKKNINDLNAGIRNKKTMSEQDLVLKDQSKQTKILEERIRKGKQRIAPLQAISNENKNINSIPSITVPSNLKKRRVKNPTSDQLNLKSKRRRCAETIQVCQAIHGGSKHNIEPAIDGMLQTLTSKCKSDVLACKILSSKQSLCTSLKKRCNERSNKEFYKSKKNIIRSLSVYYSQNVMGKRKYISVRKSNKAPGIINFVSYKTLADHINQIDIGEVRSIDPDYTEGVEDDDKGDGMYRNVQNYVPVLAKFYLEVNKERKDKLKVFTKFPKKNQSSVLFLIAVGGDEAPGSGTSFLISFLNVGKRIASSMENYLIFGANVKENSIIVKRYLKDLVHQLHYLESKVFDIESDDGVIPVEFKVEGLPNDLKMLAFLAGELSNAASYFTTFANVNKNDSNDITKEFSINGKTYWKPFSYQKRLVDAQQVTQKKKELEKKKVKAKTMRAELTSYISKQLKCRQEEPPLVLEYIDLAKCEPLHMKNNSVKELFMKILRVVLSQAKIPENILAFSEIAGDNLFVEFNEFVRTNMNCNYLKKKLITWFNENKLMKKDLEFTFRFRGKESFNYLRSFPELIRLLLTKCSDKNTKTRLTQVFFQSINLRLLVSYSVRIESFDATDIPKMIEVGRKLFRSCCLFDTSITPTVWNFSNVSPLHAKQCIESYGFGLGINTMEGREQKHQIIKRYSEKSTFQSRWSFTFRHEFIQLIYLRRNGFDCLNYRKRSVEYLPEIRFGFCSCSLKLVGNKCEICDSDEMKNVISAVLG